jgi:hypothetical protein
MSGIDLKTLIKEREKLLRKLGVIDRAIKEYESTEENLEITIDEDGKYQLEFKSYINHNKPADGFPMKETWLNKILYVLKTRERFLSNEEIAKALTAYHYEFNVDRMKRKVSVVISAAYKTNRIEGLIKIGATKSARDALWGFKKWINDKDMIKEEYRPFGKNINEKIVIG